MLYNLLGLSPLPALGRLLFPDWECARMSLASARVYGKVSVTIPNLLSNPGHALESCFDSCVAVVGPAEHEIGFV